MATVPTEDIDVLKYCVYVTLYSGNKLPPFYIGSSNVKKVMLKGYNGSVCSKKYKDVWQKERKNNPELFKTKIISLHNTRKEAGEKEAKLQTILGVISNSMYINRAVQKNGHLLYTMDDDMKSVLSKAHKGKKLSEEHKNKIRQNSLLYRHSDESKNKIKIAHTGMAKPWASESNSRRVYSDETRKKMSDKKRSFYEKGNRNHRLGQKWSQESKFKNSASQTPYKLMQFDLDNNLIKIWDSIYVAAYELDYNRHSLGTVAYKGIKYKGYIWRVEGKKYD